MLSLIEDAHGLVGGIFHWVSPRLLELCPSLLELSTQRLVFLSEDRNLRLDTFELVGEAGEERPNLARVDATEPDSEVLATYFVGIGPGPRYVSPAHGVYSRHGYLASIASCNSSVGDAAP